MSSCYKIAYAASPDDAPIWASSNTFETRERADRYIALYFSRTDKYKVCEGSWRDRESMRFGINEYKTPVWCNESFWYTYSARTDDHFVHISNTDPRLLAYTVNEDKGKRDIQTQIKPGKYLKQVFGDILTEKQIAFYAEWWAVGEKPSSLTNMTLHYAKTPDEIEFVYKNGPRSCMANDTEFKIHPARVYGAGDLQLAYLKRDDKIMARALCWPEQKGFGRVYPNPGSWYEDGYDSNAEAEEGQRHLFNLLRKEGFTSVQEDRNVLDGARLLKIEIGRDHVMPYLDNCYRVKTAGDFFTMHYNAGDHADNTNGTLNGYGDNVDDDDTTCCYECDGVVDIDETYTVYDYWSRRPHYDHSVCENCRDNHAFYCEGTDEHYRYSTADSVDVNGQTYELNYATTVAFCSDYSSEWFMNSEVVVLSDGSRWSTDEFAENGETLPNGDKVQKELEAA